MGDASVSFVGADYFTSSKTWMQVIDSDGWPNDATVSGTNFGGTVRIPSTSDYTGKYVLTWAGNGTVSLGSGTWAVDTGLSSNYTENSNGNYTNTTGSVPYIVVTASGLSSQPNLVSVTFTATGASGSFLKNFKFYRLGDQSRLDAGKVFRTPYLDALATLNPSAIRFLNWHGGNNARNCRFEHRTLPSAAGYTGPVNFVASPPYTTATYSDANQYTLSAVSTGANQTPVTMQHGEVVTTRTTTATVRSGSGFKTIVGISKGATTTFQVTAHGFSAGDTIIHLLPTGMTELDQRPVVISTVGDADHYTVAVNSTGYTNFTAGTCNQYVSLNVGARGAYPVMFEDAQVYASNYGDGYIPGSNSKYKTFYFDKSISAIKDAAGIPIFGVWLFNNLVGGAHQGDVPLEICTALVNEVNERAVALGYNNPVHMWISMPHRGLSSMDSDYTTNSNYAANAVGVILNGANGYAGLTPRAGVIIEYSNEIWNSGGSNFSQTYYLGKRGLDRWGSGLTSVSDYASMSSLRSTVMVRDIKAAFPSNPRLRFTLGAQGYLGYSAHNQSRAEGSTAYLTDALVTGGSYSTPISNHDAMNHGTYFDPVIDSDTSYYTGSGAGSFTDDSHLYNGTGPYSGAANQTQAIANFVTKASSTGNTWQTTKNFCDGSNPTAGKDYSFSSAMTSAGKASIHYEGGMDWVSRQGENDWTGTPLTANQAAFKRAVQNSTQWATAYVTDYMGAITNLANSYIPASYLITNEYTGSGGTIQQRWAHASPDTYASGTEGQALLNNPTWVAMGVRNRALVV